MAALRGLFNFIGSIVPAAAMAILILVVSADVAARNIFRIPLYIAHDIGLLAFSIVVWFGVVGCAVGGQLFGIQVVAAALPTRWRPWLSATVHVVISIVALSVIQAAVAQVTTSRFSTYLALGWPKWLVAAGLAVSMAVLIIFQITCVIDLVRQRRDVP